MFLLFSLLAQLVHFWQFVYINTMFQLWFKSFLSCLAAPTKENSVDICFKSIFSSWIMSLMSILISLMWHSTNLIDYLEACLRVFWTQITIQWIMQQFEQRWQAIVAYFWIFFTQFRHVIFWRYSYQAPLALASLEALLDREKEKNEAKAVKQCLL